MANGPTPDFDRISLKWAGVFLDGTPCAGSLVLTYNGGPMLDDDQTTPVSIYPVGLSTQIGQLTIPVGDGATTVGYVEWSVPASNDPDIAGSGGTYTIEEKLTRGGGRKFSFVADKDAPGGVIWTNKLAGSAPSTGEPLSAVYWADFSELSGRVATLEGGGTGGGGEPGESGPVTWDTIEDKPTFAPVAISGSYGDLTDQPNPPEIPTSLPPTDGSVTNDKVAPDAAIAASKLGTGTASAGKYLDGAGAWTALPVAAVKMTIPSITRS